MVYLVTKNKAKRIAVYDSLPKALAAVSLDVYSSYEPDGVDGIVIRVEEDLPEWTIEATADGVELDNYLVEKITVE